MEKSIEQFVAQALACGFTRAGALNLSALEFLPEVREMCAADRCHSYGKNWTCPPGCGTIEAITERTKAYQVGILVQTVGHLEDDFDYETITETGRLHGQYFQKLQVKLREQFPRLLPMGAGGCSICERCTYPDEPCRHPDRAFPSMEAYGLFVSRVCEKSGMPYNSGKQTITYTGCFLLE